MSRPTADLAFHLCGLIHVTLGEHERRLAGGQVPAPIDVFAIQALLHFQFTAISLLQREPSPDPYLDDLCALTTGQAERIAALALGGLRAERPADPVATGSARSLVQMQAWLAVLAGARQAAGGHAAPAMPAGADGLAAAPPPAATPTAADVARQAAARIIERIHRAAMRGAA